MINDINLDFNSENLVIDCDMSKLDDNDKQIRESVDKRDRQLKRWFLTINNPFWDKEKDTEINLETNTLPIKYDYYNYENIKSFNNFDLFEFHYVQVSAEVEETQKSKTIVEEKYIENDLEQTKLVEKEIEITKKVKKDFIVERPYFKDYISLQQYIENLDGRKWAVGQIEKGKEDGTIHLQAGLIFDDKSGKRFYTMKKFFPTAWLDKVRGSNYDLKVYCTKEDTRFLEPFEIGKFSEMRTRNDYEELKEAIKAGATNAELLEDFTFITMQFGLDKIEKFRQEYLQTYYSANCRNIETTFIHGIGGVGKTKNVYKEHGLKNIFKISNFGKFMFHGYASQKIILLDEYKGQIEITNFNNILDVYPLQLEIKGNTKCACYDKVYITSNKEFKDMYKEEQDNETRLYNAFERRIHNIIRVDENGVFHKEKETIFEDVPKEEIELDGWTKRISKIIKYDAHGKPTISFDLHNKIQQLTLEELTDKTELQTLNEIFS